MKNLLFGLIAIVLFSFSGNAQRNIHLLDVKGVEIALILNIQNNNSFNEFFVFQYNNLDFSKLTSYSSITLIESNKETISLKCDNEIFIFTINKDYRNENGTVFYGYGLSHRTGVFSLKENNSPSTIMDVLLVNGIQRAGLNCHSGGVGSTECSVDSSPIAGGGGCSVTCGTGYYSCCDDTRNECRCIEKKKTLTTN